MIGRTVPAYEKSVFINCPFDSTYRDLMLAIVLSVSSHGLIPRSARETEGDAEPRFSRLLTTIATSKYSIHDLSRSKGEGSENLGRFNMPLELGMAAAFRHERHGSDRPHQWLPLVPEGFSYQKFVSDLAGFDPARHDSSVISVIREVSAWLRTLDDALNPAPSALRIYQSFPDFLDKFASLRANALDKETWGDVLLAASQTAVAAFERNDLSYASLRGSSFTGINMSRSVFYQADMSGITLRDVNLSKSILRGANLRGAVLADVDMTDVDLAGAELNAADLRMTRGLTQLQLNSANGDQRTRLPLGLTIPKHWRERSADEDSGTPIKN